MTFLVTLTALGTDIRVLLSGLTGAQLNLFLSSWESCGAVLASSEGGDAEVSRVLESEHGETQTVFSPSEDMSRGAHGAGFGSAIVYGVLASRDDVGDLARET